MHVFNQRAIFFLSVTFTVFEIYPTISKMISFHVGKQEAKRKKFPIRLFFA